MNKLIIPIVVTVAVAVGIGAFFVFQKPAFPQPLMPPEQTLTQEPKLEKLSIEGKKKENDNVFGVNIRYGKEGSGRVDPQQLHRMYVEVGVQTGTVGAYYQATVKMMQIVDDEGPRQTYNWSRRLDGVISQTASSGIESLIILSPYNTRARMPNNMEYWKAFVKEIVRHYSARQRGSVRYFELVNEPAVPSYWDDTPENYALLLRSTYQAVKEADPHALVVFGSIPVEVVVNQPSRQDFFRKVLSYRYDDGSKAEDYFDLIDIHIYDDAESFEKYVKKVNGWLTRAKPMIMTETGTTSDPKYEGSLEKQARDVVKRFVTALSLGFKKVYWQPFSDHKTLGAGGTDRFDKMGLVDMESNPKLSYYTYKKMVEVLEGSDWNNIQTIQEKDGVYIYKFKKGSKNIWVAWNDNSNSKQITISGISSNSVKITEAVPKYETGKEVADYNTAFNTETKSVSGGKATITLKDTPVFVEEK